MIKLLAFSDLHLGRSSAGLPGRSDGISTNEGWMRIVDCAIRNQVNAVLLGGDCIDRDNVFFESIGRMAEGFKRLDESGIDVFMVGGNHDFSSLPEAIRAAGAQNIQLLGENAKWEAVERTYNGEAIQFVGWSFPSRHYKSSPMKGIDAVALRHDTPVIGLLHGDLAVDSPYAPVTLTELFNTPVDYWLLGHIHKPQPFLQGGKRADYPGSPQALSPKETGAHGVLLIEVAGKFNIEVQSIPLSPVRYEQLTVDLTGIEQDKVRSEVINTLREVTEQEGYLVGDLKALVFDVTVAGQQADFAAVSRELEGLVSDFEVAVQGVSLSVRKLNLALEPVIENLHTLAQQQSPVGSLAKLILALENEEPSELANRVLERFDARFEELTREALFGGLRERGREVMYYDEQRELKKQRVTDECRRLLSELLNQSNLPAA